MFSSFFFFNDPATTEIYTLSLHDALPIFDSIGRQLVADYSFATFGDSEKAILPVERALKEDRKSTRLNSSHGYISYAVFCLKKKKKEISKSLTQEDAGEAIVHDGCRSGIK